VEHDAADELHVEGADAQGAHRGLTYRGVGFGQQVVEAGAVVELLPEPIRLGAQFDVGHPLHVRLEAGDALDDRPDLLHLAVVRRTHDLLDDLQHSLSLGLIVT
jgi:hypothetical protein